MFVMIRPRGGDFLYSDREVEVMKADIRLAKLHGADGLVFGALTEDGRIDTELCTALLGKSIRGQNRCAGTGTVTGSGGQCCSVQCRRKNCAGCFGLHILPVALLSLSACSASVYCHTYEALNRKLCRPRATAPLPQAAHTQLEATWDITNRV